MRSLLHLKHFHTLFTWLHWVVLSLRQNSGERLNEKNSLADVYGIGMWRGSGSSAGTGFSACKGNTDQLGSR
jgi:hypothetical protein